MNTDVELLVPAPVTGTSRVDGDTTADVGFNRRWALWLKRGRAHDRRVRRRFRVLFGVLLIAAVLLYAFLA